MTVLEMMQIRLMMMVKIMTNSKTLIASQTILTMTLLVVRRVTRRVATMIVVALAKELRTAQQWNKESKRIEEE